jgi:Inositol monophosphatase family
MKKVIFKQVIYRRMSSNSVFLQVLSASVKAADRAGQLVRDIMKQDDLGIVQKTGEKDLQTLADRTANDCIVGSLKKVCICLSNPLRCSI